MKNTSEYFTELYGSIKSEYMSSGSGLLATIMSIVPRGGKLILGRNSGKSAFDALRLGGIEPVYMRAEFTRAYGLYGGISPDEVRMACEDNSDATAVLVTSPNYYGILSDITTIADIVHRYGMVLIVDQTSGGHLNFFDAVNNTISAAEDMGADVVVNSISRSLLGIEGSSVINVMTERVDISALQDMIRMIQGGMPEAKLNAQEMSDKLRRMYGSDHVNSWTNDLRYVYRELKSIHGVRVITANELDPVHINISLADIGLGGAKLAYELRTRDIQVDMIHGDYVLWLSTADKSRSDYVALIAAIRKLAAQYELGIHRNTREMDSPKFALACSEVPMYKISIPLYQADGRVLYDPIIAYPPGAPLACPGEVLNIDLISYVSRAIERGDTVVGVDEEGYVMVGAE